MPNQPSCPSPYLSSVDVTSEVTFSCLVTDPVYGYILTIKNADNGEILLTKENMSFAKNSFNEEYTPPLPLELVEADGAKYLEVVLSDEDKAVLENGKNYVWNIELFSGNLYKVTTPIENYLSSYDSIGVSKNDDAYLLAYIGLPIYIYRNTSGASGYKFAIITKIVDYNEDKRRVYYSTPFETSYGYDYTANFFIGLYQIQSPDYYFVAKKNPDITFEVNPTITSSVLDVSVSYFQEQMATVSYYCFNLYSEDEELIDTTGNVFSSNIKYLYNGLIIT